MSKILATDSKLGLSFLGGKELRLVCKDPNDRNKKNQTYFLTSWLTNMILESNIRKRCSLAAGQSGFCTRGLCSET